MSEPEFDPYRQWLGIENKDDSTNHYQLLGLELFENDSEKIAAAADRQMQIVRKHQTGPRSHYTQQLLAELAQAKTCLQNPESRVQYDESLLGPIPQPQAASNHTIKWLTIASGIILTAAIFWVVGRNFLLSDSQAASQNESGKSTDPKRVEKNAPQKKDAEPNQPAPKNLIQQNADGSLFLNPSTAIISSPNVSVVKEYRQDFLANWTSSNDSVLWNFQLSELHNTYFDGAVSYKSKSGAQIKIETERLSKTLTLPPSDTIRSEEFIVRLMNRKPKQLVLKLIDAGDEPLKIQGVKLTPR